MTIVVSLVFSFILIGFIVFCCVIWPELKTYAYRNNEPCLSFEKFKAFYDVCPERFKLEDEYFCILTPCKYSIIPFSSHPYFFKTNKDVRKYRKFKTDLYILESQKHSARLLADFTDLMNEAINDKIKMIKQQLDDANKEQQKIIGKLKNEKFCKGW